MRAQKALRHKDFRVLLSMWWGFPRPARADRMSAFGGKADIAPTAQNDGSTPFPPTLAAQRCRRPRKFSDLCEGIERVPRINKAGTTGGEKFFHFTDGFGDHAVRLTGLKLAL